MKSFFRVTITMMLTGLVVITGRGTETAPLQFALTANRLADLYLQQETRDAEALAAFLAKHRIKPGSAVDGALARAVALGTAIAAAGTEPGTETFRSVLAENNPAGSGVSVAQPAPPTPKPAPVAPAQATFDGMKKLAAVSQTRRLYEARLNGIALVKPDEPSPFGRLRAKPDSTPAATALEALTAPPVKPEALDDLLKTTPATLQKYYQDYGTPPQSASAATGGSEKKAPAATAAGAALPELADDVRLRDAGFSFAYGLGTVFGNEDDYAIAAVMVRWNIIQRLATIRWNHRISTSPNSGRKRITYFGREGAELLEDKLGLQASPADITAVLSQHWIEPTFLGPFLGTALAGDSVEFQAETLNRDALKQRPWLAGLSIGWGFLDEAAPALTLDIGAAISPTKGLAPAKFYVGVSMDLETAGKILDRLRPGTVPKPSAPEAKK